MKFKWNESCVFVYVNGNKFKIFERNNENRKKNTKR